MANAWNEQTWGIGNWGQQDNQTVLVTGLSTSFGIGTESVDVTVDAGWGRSTWGSFAWNENITIEVDVTGVTMATSLGTTTQEVGTGVIVSVTGLSMTSALGATTQEASAVETLDSLTIGAALSGASGITGEGNVGVIAPSDQLDFSIGTVTIDIFTQVDPTAVTMASAAGTATVEADALVTLGSLSSTFALGTETVEVGTGVIVSVSTVALTFAEGTATLEAGATVNVSGVDLSLVSGNLFSTPWANVVTGASNTWTEVDAA